MKEVENRVLVLEIAQTNTNKEIAELKNETKILKEGLEAINDSIKQVRNVVIGIALTFVLINTGIIQAVKVALSAGL